MRRLLTYLSGLYAVAVVLFCTAGVLHDRPDWADATRTAARDVRDAVVAWTSNAADSVDETVTAWLADEPKQAPPTLRGTQSDEQTAQAPKAAPVPVAKPAPVETQVAAAPAPEAQPAPPAVTETAPQTAPEQQQAPDTQVADATQNRQTQGRGEYSPQPAMVTRVRERLRASLTDDLYGNFDLFVYVSKADHGPWAQRMFVFTKDMSGLKLLHAWPVSTGREATEPDAHGRLRVTSTPAGFYQLDPHRMLRNYRSVQWDAPMPHSMFFNWIRKGSLTGLAIHGVEGDEIPLLGQRASAGCVRLSPQSAEALFNLIHDNYRGEVPRFAIDRRRYSTMSNQGELMRNREGELMFSRGYRVLVYIDGYGGAELVSAIY